jgi:hypothetical protein
MITILGRLCATTAIHFSHSTLLSASHRDVKHLLLRVARCIKGFILSHAPWLQESRNVAFRHLFGLRQVLELDRILFQNYGDIMVRLRIFTLDSYP